MAESRAAASPMSVRAALIAVFSLAGARVQRRHGGGGPARQRRLRRRDGPRGHAPRQRVRLARRGHRRDRRAEARQPRRRPHGLVPLDADGRRHRRRRHLRQPHLLGRRGLRAGPGRRPRPAPRHRSRAASTAPPRSSTRRRTRTTGSPSRTWRSAATRAATSSSSSSPARSTAASSTTPTSRWRTTASTCSTRRRAPRRSPRTPEPDGRWSVELPPGQLPRPLQGLQLRRPLRARSTGRTRATSTPRRPSPSRPGRRRRAVDAKLEPGASIAGNLTDPGGRQRHQRLRHGLRLRPPRDRARIDQRPTTAVTTWSPTSPPATTRSASSRAVAAPRT